MAAPALDPDLVAAAHAGDATAIERLLAVARPDIRRYARRSCASSADVEDAVQETLWLLYRHVGRLRALAAASAWLLAVVTRECHRLARRAGSRLLALDDAMADATHAERFTQRPQHELRLDLARAIESLPPHYREVVLLRDMEELTIDEIAAALSISRESAKARLHRARGLLREYLLK